MNSLIKFQLLILFLAFCRPAGAADLEIVKKNYQFKASTHKPFQIRMEVDAGRVQVQPGDSDREIFLSLRYEEERFEIDVNFDKRDNELKVLFDINKWLDKEDYDESKASLKVELPRNVPIKLYCKTKAGETDLELGGLKIQDLVLRVLAGETFLGFKEPNRDEIEELRIENKIGELTVEKLGNANFRFASIGGNIGELSIDLTGDIKPEKDREIDFDLNIGETRIYLPEEEAIRLRVSKFLFLSAVDVPLGFRKEGKYYFSKNYDRAKYKTKINVSPGLGSLDIRLR